MPKLRELTDEQLQGQIDNLEGRNDEKSKKLHQLAIDILSERKQKEEESEDEVTQTPNFNYEPIIQYAKENTKTVILGILGIFFIYSFLFSGGSSSHRSNSKWLNYGNGLINLVNYNKISPRTEFMGVSFQQRGNTAFAEPDWVVGTLDNDSFSEKVEKEYRFSIMFDNFQLIILSGKSKSYSKYEDDYDDFVDTFEEIEDFISNNDSLFTL